LGDRPPILFNQGPQPAGDVEASLRLHNRRFDVGQPGLSIGPPAGQQLEPGLNFS
jgi:hypothetical protein